MTELQHAQVSSTIEPGECPLCRYALPRHHPHCLDAADCVAGLPDFNTFFDPRPVSSALGINRLWPGENRCP